MDYMFVYEDAELEASFNQKHELMAPVQNERDIDYNMVNTPIQQKVANVVHDSERETELQGILDGNEGDYFNSETYYQEVVPKRPKYCD